MPDRLKVEEIADVAGLEALRTDWLDLWRRVPAATPFQSPAWLVPWWRVFDDGELMTLALQQNDRTLDQGRDYETVLIENIRLHGDAEQTQLRERIDEETVARYAEALERGERFPLVELVPAGDGTYYIADGWHRVLAHKAAGRGVIDALILVVAPGADPLRTAIRYALRANLKHGLPLTKGDQSKRARTALLMPWFEGWSLRQLEREIKVGKSTIARVKTDLVRSGELPRTADGEPAPDYLPPEYAAEQRLDMPLGAMRS